MMASDFVIGHDLLISHHLLSERILQMVAAMSYLRIVCCSLRHLMDEPFFYIVDEVKLHAFVWTDLMQSFMIAFSSINVFK